MYFHEPYFLILAIHAGIPIAPSLCISNTKKVSRCLGMWPFELIIHHYTTTPPQIMTVLNQTKFTPMLHVVSNL